MRLGGQEGKSAKSWGELFVQMRFCNYEESVVQNKEKKDLVGEGEQL